jgi:steroid delta-isomerase-like uncharacterized protein
VSGEQNVESIIATNLEQDLAFARVVLNDHRLDQIESYVRSVFVEENPAPGQGPGRDGLREFLAGFLTAFPDLTWTVQETVAQGNTVAAWSIWKGKHAGEFMGIPATGRQVSVEAWTFDRFRDGRMASSRILMDQLGLLRQLGAIPAM